MRSRLRGSRSISFEVRRCMSSNHREQAAGPLDALDLAPGLFVHWSGPGTAAARARRADQSAPDPWAPVSAARSASRRGPAVVPWPTPAGAAITRTLEGPPGSVQKEDLFVSMAPCGATPSHAAPGRAAADSAAAQLVEFPPMSMPPAYQKRQLTPGPGRRVQRPRPLDLSPRVRRSGRARGQYFAGHWSHRCRCHRAAQGLDPPSPPPRRLTAAPPALPRWPGARCGPCSPVSRRPGGPAACQFPPTPSRVLLGPAIPPATGSGGPGSAGEGSRTRIKTASAWFSSPGRPGPSRRPSCSRSERVNARRVAGASIQPRPSWRRPRRARFGGRCDGPPRRALPGEQPLSRCHPGHGGRKFDGAETAFEPCPGAAPAL